MSVRRSSVWIFGGGTLFGAVVIALLVVLVTFRVLNQTSVTLLGHGYWEMGELQPNRRGFWERYYNTSRLFMRDASGGVVDLGEVENEPEITSKGKARWNCDGWTLEYDPMVGSIDTLGRAVPGQ